MDGLPDRGLRGPRPGARRRAGHRAVPERARSAAITYATGGNTRYPKETLDCAAGGRNARLDNFQTAAVWSGRRRSTLRARGGPDKGQQRELAAFADAVRDRRADAHLARVAGRHHQRHPRGGRQPRERPPGAGVTVPQPSGWAGTRAGPPGCRRPRWPGGPVTRRVSLAWSRRQVRPRARFRRPAGRSSGERRFTAVLPGGTAGRVPAAAEARPAGRGGPADARRVGGARRRPDRPGAPGLVPRPGDRPPVLAGPLRVPDQPPLRRADRQRQAGLGDLPPAAPHAAGRGLVPDRRRGVRAPGGGPAAVLVPGEPVPVRRALDQRDRGRHPADQPGLDPAPARRLARRRRPVRGRRARGAADPLAPAVPRRVPEPRLVREQPRHRRGGGTAGGELRLPVVRARAAAGGGNPRALLERELRRNTFPSGINRELASDYQGFVAELGLLAAVEAGGGRPSAERGVLAAALRDDRRAAALVDERAAGAPAG